MPSLWFHCHLQSLHKNRCFYQTFPLSNTKSTPSAPLLCTYEGLYIIYLCKASLSRRKALFNIELTTEHAVLGFLSLLLTNRQKSLVARLLMLIHVACNRFLPLPLVHLSPWLTSPIGSSLPLVHLSPWLTSPLGWPLPLVHLSPWFRD